MAYLEKLSLDLDNIQKVNDYSHIPGYLDLEQQWLGQDNIHNPFGHMSNLHSPIQQPQWFYLQKIQIQITDNTILL